jgi:hypothetical protein
MLGGLMIRLLALAAILFVIIALGCVALAVASMLSIVAYPFIKTLTPLVLFIAAIIKEIKNVTARVIQQIKQSIVQRFQLQDSKK